MKKLLIGFLVLTASLVLTGCASSEDKEVVNDAFGRMMLPISTAGVADDFYLSRVQNSDGVDYEWVSNNTAIEIVKEKAKLTYDTEEYDYYKAKVTQPSDGAVTGTLEVTISKGGAKKVWTENCRVVPRYIIETYDDLASYDDDTYVKVTLEIEKTSEINTSTSSSSYNTFSPTLAGTDGSSIYVYRIPAEYHSLCDEVGKKVTIYAQKSAYNGKAQLKSITLVVAA